MKNQYLNVRTTALAVVLALPVTSAWGAQPGHGETSLGAAEAAFHAEATVVIDENLTLSDLLSRTLERHPGSGVLKAGQATVAAEEKYGSRWIPGATELSGFHLSDRQLDDTGVYENEAALNFPLWLPGEKKAQTALGEAMSISQASREAEFHWQISGLLRRQSWELLIARRQYELAKEQEQRLADLLDQVTLFTEVGDTSRADLLDTMQELAQWKAERMTLEASFQDAAREFIALTGSFHLPATLKETLSTQQEVSDAHPVLRRALDDMTEASAEAEAVSQANSVRPSVNVFWRGYRGDRASPDVNALGLGFSMPLGKSPSRRPEIARANEELAKAEAGMLLTRRELDLQLHEAEHQLHVTRQKLDNSTAMMASATEKYQLDKLSFELGEISVRQWLRRLSEYKEIEQSHELLLLQQGAAVAAYNQAVGESL